MPIIGISHCIFLLDIISSILFLFLRSIQVTAPSGELTEREPKRRACEIMAAGSVMLNYNEQNVNSAPTLQHEVLPHFQNDKKTSLRKEMGSPLDFPVK